LLAQEVLSEGSAQSFRVRVRRRILGLSDASAARRLASFEISDATVRAHFDSIIRSFYRGYHLALEAPELIQLGARLDELDALSRGFAYEGASMALALLDGLTASRGRRWRAFVAGPAEAHTYMAHVGYGWALTRLPFRNASSPNAVAPLNPTLRWLALDGCGFHAGFFHTERVVRRQSRPRGFTGYALRSFDQGLGRSLWFVAGANAERLSSIVCDFSARRQSDLWSGVGLACAYAGGTREPERTATALLTAAGDSAASFAQGVAFASEARSRARTPAEHTDRTCRAVFGLSAGEVAHLTARAAVGLRDRDDAPAYQEWRERAAAVFRDSRLAKGNSELAVARASWGRA
jgi:hypothetical protein